MCAETSRIRCSSSDLSDLSEAQQNPSPFFQIHRKPPDFCAIHQKASGCLRKSSESVRIHRKRRGFPESTGKPEGDSEIRGIQLVSVEFFWIVWKRPDRFGIHGNALRIPEMQWHGRKSSCFSRIVSETSRNARTGPDFARIFWTSREVCRTKEKFSIPVDFGEVYQKY